MWQTQYWVLKEIEKEENTSSPILLRQSNPQAKRNKGVESLFEVIISPLWQYTEPIS